LEFKLLDARFKAIETRGNFTFPSQIEIETSLPAALAPFSLPASPTGAELKGAIRASLAVLDLARDRVTVPTLGAVWRSILGAADFSVFVYGATGRFKTALASLLQQHFGTGFAAHRLPGSWASTANFNEVLTFIAKDTLFVIDDFRPGAAERRRLEGEVDRLLRAAANGAGRGRLKSNDSLRPADPPRALILATGEERPSGCRSKTGTIVTQKITSQVIYGSIRL
jgi:hypothetical protein